MKQTLKRFTSLLLAVVMLMGLLPQMTIISYAAGTKSTNELEGKTISILGDSISTFSGVSNNTEANATLNGGAVYYSAGTLGVHREDTWWQQIVDLLELELLVNNSWSGSCILHTRVGTAGAYKDRCVQLHNDKTGEEPDIIAVFLGTNDFSYYQSALGTADIDYAALITDNGDGTYTYADPTTSCEAYAIMLHKMTVRYPDAEVYCMTMLPRRDPVNSGADVGQPTAFNAELNEIILKFGCIPVDLEHCGMTAEPSSFDLYMGDKRVHPNAEGMDLMTQALIDAMMGQKNASFTVTFDLNNVTANTAGGIVLSGEAFAVDLTVAAGFDEPNVTVTMGGTDITAAAYADGKITIGAVTGDVAVTASAKVEDTPDYYRWELKDNALVSTGETDNALTKKAGTIANGVISNAWFQLEKRVVLCHSQPWVVEWSASGNWSGMLFSANSTSTAANNRYLFKTTTATGFVGFGERVGSSFENYGIALQSKGIDTTGKHTYRLENCIAADGSNMAYLLVDGVDCGPMNNFFIGGNSDQGKTVDWLNGQDLCFFYVGTSGHAINNCALDYIQVWEGGELAESLPLRYDDRYDITGKTVEIVDAGKPTSYQVGYGVAENSVLDTAVVTLDGDKLIATGIGTAKVRIDGQLYEVTVEAAPISLLLLAGQSNMQGIDGNGAQSIACPDGQVYATYADRWMKTVEDVSRFAPSALSGQYRTVNVTGTTEDLSNYPVYMLTEEGNGREGMDSGIAYEWNRQTGEKVWVVNMGYGGSSINAWQKGGTHYNNTLTVFSHCTETLRKEIAAGHYTLSHMGYFWCQGCADETQTPQWYEAKYQAMHKAFKDNLAFDHDSDPATPDASFEFAGIIPIRSGHQGAGSYRAGAYTQTTSASYYTSFKDLRMNGPRVAQYWMGNNPELTDIWNVCTIQETWATMPDGSDGVSEYFNNAYANGTVDYEPQVAQSASWYKPTTPTAVHDNIHYNQIGYNEIGRESARNALINLGEMEAPETEASVKFVIWDGFSLADTVATSGTGNADTLVVPMVSPVYLSKTVNYTVSEGLDYSWYDLTAQRPDATGTLKASVGDTVVTAVPRAFSSYRWSFDGSGLKGQSGEGFTDNEITKAGGTFADGVFNNQYYYMSQTAMLCHDKAWSVEWVTDKWNTTQGSMILSAGTSTGGAYIYQRATDYFVGIGYYDNGVYHNYGISLKPLGLLLQDGEEHSFRIENRIAVDNSNQICLIVDGADYGPLAEHYTNSELVDNNTDWLAGRDFAFSALGSSDFPLRGLVLQQLTVNETGENIRWEQGTIAYATGLNREDTTRLRIANYLPMADYGGVTVGEGYELVRFVYDKDYRLLSGTDWLGSGVGFSVDRLREQYPEGVYFRIAVRSVDNRTLSVADVTTSGVSFLDPGEKVPGVKVLDYADLYTIGSWQEGALWNGKIFLLNASGTGAVYSESDGTKLGSFNLEGTDAILPHANSVCFGTEYYVPGDAYPLLYVNVYNNYANAVDRMEGTCCVYRITQSGEIFSGQLVQIIRIGFTDDLSLWKSMENNGDVRSYGNFVVDRDSGTLYTYTMRDKERVTRFFRFAMPALTDGEYSADYGCNIVTLQETNITDQFDLPYFNYLQGVTFCDGKLISAEGLSANMAALRVIDLDTRSVECTYMLSAAGLTAEPEVLCTNHAYNSVYYAAADGVLRKLYLDEIDAPDYQLLSLKYDDRYDITGKRVEIVDAGKPTSFQVGYGVAENSVLDTAVVTLEGDKLIATGIGTAKVRIDGQLYEVTVETAPISLLLLAGQSNMRGSEGNANQSIVCPDGMVYATYGDDRGADNTAMTVNNAAMFAPSALAGEYSTINSVGTTDCLSGYPVHSLTEAGAGKIGPDSGFAYEWVKSTGEKVWVINAAHGGTSISVWQPGTKEYEECQALFAACAETLRKEIAAGHFTLNHMGYFWCQGCADRTQSATWYGDKYLAMHEAFKTELAFDHDSDSATADKTFEFGGIIPVRVGNTSTCYRDGVNTDSNPYAYHESFVDLRMSGPRVAQYWMGNNPELEDIWTVCTIGDDWVWMPDGTNGVSDYFNKHYTNGTVDYKPQVAQSASWYTPTTPKAVHDSIHYNQIGYNEIGRESVRNALIMLGEKEDYAEETTVRFVDWTGYKEVNEITASTTAGSGTLVVPIISPVTRAKSVTFSTSNGLKWNYGDLTADTAGTSGTLSADGLGVSVNVVKAQPGQHYADHLSTLPESYCANTDLWKLLEHDSQYYASGAYWGSHSSGQVYSVTIPVSAGDKIFATSFGKSGENGHASTSGIRTTFFNAYGIAKTMTPAETYAEFSANGGYLIAPEGTTAVNVAMWTNGDENELYILSAEHKYVGGICTICGAQHPALADWSGKIISILSASTSTFKGYIPVADGFNLTHRTRYPDTSRVPDVTSVDQTWWMQLITSLDAKLGINDSWAGSQVLNTLDANSGDLGPDAAMASMTRIQNLGANGSPDVILFFGAGNDMGRGVPLGSFDPATAPTTVDLTTIKWETLADAYVAAIMRLQHAYPDAQIVAVTTYAMPSYATAAKLDKYIPVLKAICDHYGVPTVDLRDSGVTFDMLPDNIHPNAEGMDLITEAVLHKLLNDIPVESGENVVYTVSHELDNAVASLGYYKGVSAGETFTETLTGDDLTATVTMGGVDITADVYKNGKIAIPEVTGDIVITARAAFNADGHLQQLPEDVCAGTNLWTALEPENIYYTVSGWGNTANGNSWSITFPVQAGDRIWATSLGAYPGNGSTANGVRVTWFDENGVLETVSRDVVYSEFSTNGYLTAPEGAVALNLPMTDNEPNYAIYLLDRAHNYESAITVPTCTEQGYTTYTCECGDSYADDYTEAAEHTYKNGFCTFCSAKETNVITPPGSGLAVTVTPANYAVVSNVKAEKLACAPCFVSYGEGKFAVAYLADEVNTVESEGSTTISVRVALFESTNPQKLHYVDVAAAGQTIGDVTIGSKAPYEPNLIAYDDGTLLVIFNLRDTAGHYMYYSAMIDTETLEVTNYQSLTLDGKIWNPANIAASYHSYSGNSISAPTGSMVFTSQIILRDGFFYGYCGGISSGFAGMLVRSSDGVNWSTILAPEAVSEMAGVIECGFRFVGNTAYFCMRDISSGVYHCSYDLVSGKQLVKTEKLSELTTSKTATFLQNGKLYLIANKVTGDDSSVGRRNTAQIFEVNSESGNLTLVKQVFCADGIAYHSVVEYGGTNYWCFHTDARRINPYTQGRSNLALIEMPALAVACDENGVLQRDRLNGFVKSGCITAAVNQWQTGVVNLSYQLPITCFTGWDSVTVTANEENKCYMAFFCSEMKQAGDVAYAEGWTNQVILEPGETQTFRIPADATYLYILNNNAAGNDLFPAKVQFSTAAHTHSYTATVTPPACTEQGYTTYTCECGDSYVDDHVDASGHSYEATVTYPAGLTKGYTNYTCTSCADAYRTAWLDAAAYEGKTIACVGDSITCGVGVTKDETDYVTLLAKQLGMDYIRLGVSGTTLCTDGSRTCNISKLTEGNVNGADVVTIAMGINDFCAAAEGYYELGDINSTDSSTIYGATRMWCERIVELRKTDSLNHTQFYFVTPVIASWNNSVTSARNWDQSKTNIHGYTLRDLCNAIIEVAALYDIPVIDLNLISGMYYNNADDNNVAAFGGDGVHPGVNGHAMMAGALANALLQNEMRDDHTHTYGSWVTTKYPGCEDGEEKRVCSVCTATESQVLNGTGHSYSSVVTDPTCVEQGYTTHTCAFCGDSYVDSYVDALGHTYINGICVVCGYQANESGLIHAIPENDGVKNAIDRAYALTDVLWTPLADVPGVHEINGEYFVIPFEAGVTYKGIPYSGVTANDCYVGLNVSLESFLTALENGNSVLYTENLNSTNPKSATYFGTVCSKFAQYVLDIPGSYNTNNVANIPGMETIAMPGTYTVDQIKLGDVVLNTATHTTVCTDILYDTDGNVAYIEIAEAVMPLVRRMLWSPEEFYEHFADYRLCRYQHIDEVPAANAVNVDGHYALMPRFGDKYNYRVSSTKGVVDVLDSGYYKAVALRDGVIADEIILNGATSFSFDRNIPGYLEMYLEKEDGSRSSSVYACVVKSSVSVTDSSEFGLGKLTVNIDGNCGTPLYVQVGSAHAIFCNVEGCDGAVELAFSTSKISTQQVRVAYQNEYGIYLSSWVPFTAETNPSNDPLLSQGEYWNGYNITPNNPTPVIQENKEGYWSYTMVPVEENTLYYSEGATRMWFLDENGNGISTYNAYKDGEIPFQFTTPAKTAYVSVAYSPDLVEQGTETLKHVHRYQLAITAPTCTEQGYTTYTCHCGDSYVDDYVDTMWHNYEDGSCSVCGCDMLRIGAEDIIRYQGGVNSENGTLNTIFTNNWYTDIRIPKGAEQVHVLTFKTGGNWGSAFYNGSTYLSGFCDSTVGGQWVTEEIPENATLLRYGYLYDTIAQNNNVPTFQYLEFAGQEMEAWEPSGYMERPSTGCHSFTVEVNIAPAQGNPNGYTPGTDYGYIQLPTSYSSHGEPTRLIIVCHGASAELSTYQSDAWKNTNYSFWTDLGYAVMDMYACPEALAEGSELHYGNPVVVDCYKEGYDYVMEHFNLKQDGIYLIGSSMGGLSSFQIAQSGLFPVIAQVGYCPAIDLFKQAYVNPWTTASYQRSRIASYFGFTGTAPAFTNTKYPSEAEIKYYKNNFAKTVAYAPILSNVVSGDLAKIFDVIPSSATAVSAEEEALYQQLTTTHPNPLMIFHNTDDGTVAYRYSKYFVDMVNRSGQNAVLRTFTSGGHNAWANGANVTVQGINGQITIKESQYEAYMFFNQMEQHAEHCEWVDPAVEATCTETGLTEGKHCSVCGEILVKQNVIPAKGHTEAIDPAIAPTCTETGLTEGKHCSVCDETIAAQEVIPERGHKYDDGVITMQPSEYETGVKTYTCGACGHTKTESVPALGHEHSYSAAVTKPTCTEGGYTAYTCRCGDSYVDDYVDATGHSCGEWYELDAPTCTTEGEDRRDCDNCDHYETRTVNALGHDLTLHEAIEPTCTAVGWEAYETCSRCDYSTYEEVPATGHSHAAEVTPPTCTEQGYTTYTCHCGDSYVDDYVDATGHGYGEWYEVDAPTCTTEGEDRRDCDNCDHYETRMVDALGHDLTQHEAKEPTCMAAGWEAYETCSRCAHTTYTEVLAIGHSFTNYISDDNATTSEDGTKTAHCDRMGCTETDTVIEQGSKLIVVSLAITCHPVKVLYIEGEDISVDGMIVTAIYSNDTIQNITGYMLSGYDKTELGVQEITVSYGGCSASFTVTVCPNVPSRITSALYKVLDGFIRKIPLGTTARELLEGVNETIYVKLYSESVEVPDTTVVGTGMIMSLMDGDAIKDSVTVVVTGDSNGDGKLTITDMLAVKAHLLNKGTLTGAYAEASDTNGDEKITITDFIQMKAHVLGKSSVAEN